MKTPVALALLLLAAGPATNEESGFARAMAAAARGLEAGDLAGARASLERALERDPNASAAWELVERWAEKKGSKDERVYALHRQLALARARKADKATIEALNARLAPLDPVAPAFAALRANYVEKLTKLAEGYEKGKRLHSAIRAYKQALALDPERADLSAIVERLAASPDPSLAEDARPRDLLEGLSAEWIQEHDAAHHEWKDRARLERPNYVTQTDAGYAVLVRTAEAMEQMNAFYRRFFRYGWGEDKRSVSRIEVNIYKAREEYTKDPKDWSGGHFTGGAVETYIGPGGFEDMTSTLFHEAAHQFVSLATNSAGWLNEGMASFFEGTRILANGTVLMNLPANHRLFPLVERIEKGWMASVEDGIDPKDVTKEPPKAPTFRIVLENQYEWGPPWYAPTWGVVFFLYNFQDPADGRFVYRKGFFDYVDSSGGKMGKGAIEALEEVLLAHPAPVTPGLFSSLKLPTKVDELDAIWKSYLVELRDRQTGKSKDAAPYREWAKNAKKRGELDDAAEFYEKALLGAPRDVDLLCDFAELLVERKEEDRATKLLGQAAAELELGEPVDGAPANKERLDHVERRLAKLDPDYLRLDDVRTALLKDANAVVERYLAEGLNLQAMELSSHLGSELAAPALFAGYEKAVLAVGHSNARWKLAYDEQSLKGWNAASVDSVFRPNGETLDAKFGTYSAANDYVMLTLDEVTSGDFSMEAEVEAQHGRVKFAGLVFGRKGDTDFHALVLFPPPPNGNGFADLVTFFGSGTNKTWRRNPVADMAGFEAGPTATRAEGGKAFYKLRVDVTGKTVDVWVNGEFTVSQEFPSQDVLRGSFGLLTGRGETRFRNVRYLARHPRDPSSAIERKLVMAELNAGGTSINGSWMGLVPPFPSAQTWFQGARTSWAEARGFPQLLVLWSTEQNDQIPIDAYLRSLHDKHKDVGLRIVNLLGGWNKDGAQAYLAKHSFPDSVALDTANEKTGVTFEQYDIARFHLPRFVLLDVDGTVSWEGDPGFPKGQAWGGEESLLDVPLRELIVKRKVKEFLAWKGTWPAARAALAAGDFAAAVGALKGALAFDPAVSSEVAEASAFLGAVEAAVSGADELAATLAAEGREPALEVLLAWAEALGKPIKKTKPVTAALKSPNLAAWKRAPTILKPALGKVGKDAAAVAAALGKIADLPGAFPGEFAEAGKSVAEDAAGLGRLLNEAPSFPARWLASEHFHW